MENSHKTDNPATSPKDEILNGSSGKVFESFFDPEPGAAYRPPIVASRDDIAYTSCNGVIESSRQIIRNESGQANHKPYVGKYQPKALKDSSSIKPVKESQISWFSAVIFAVVVILAIAELSLFRF